MQYWEQGPNVGHYQIHLLLALYLVHLNLHRMSSITLAFQTVSSLERRTLNSYMGRGKVKLKQEEKKSLWLITFAA